MDMRPLPPRADDALSPLRPSHASGEDKPRRDLYRWPTPPFAAYPVATEQRQALDCEINAFNGKRLCGKLTFFVPEERVAHLQLPGTRTTTTVRFDQFRLLRLLEPLRAQAGDAGADDPASAWLHARPSSPYTLKMTDGSTMQGETVGHVMTEAGLFLFLPQDDQGTVERIFVPASSYESAEVGPRLGEVLVAHQAVSAEHVEQAAAQQQAMRAHKLGDILVESQVVSPEQLLAALEQQSRMPMMRIGEALKALGMVTDAQLNEALERQRAERGVPLGQLLLQLKHVSQQDLQTALAHKMGYPLVDVMQFPVDPECLKRVPYTLSVRLESLPLMTRIGSMIVAMENPLNHAAIEELEFVTQLKVVPAMAQIGRVTEAVQLHYQRGGLLTGDQDRSVELFDAPEEAGVHQLATELSEAQAQAGEQQEDRPIEQSDNTLVRLINQMILEAHRQGVSDIHIECYPGKEKVKVRFRKDGALHPYLDLPTSYRSALVARLKIMCDLDISEKRKPQDGKMDFSRFGGARLELRVATIPTNNGVEDVVMRLLASAKPIPIDDLGMSPPNLHAMKQAMERPYGMVLCVGPTGSGKTTTLHSALSHINVPERKIWTAEDPVEITQPGLRQVQVNPKIDWTFAKALRAFLRADPDVIMIGEIRDRETAAMAIEASLTGHLVLSTLHTNSAPETVTRLLDMGMDPFNFADSLLAVLAQRLVRRLCSHCRIAEPMGDEQLDELLGDYLHAAPKDMPELQADTLRTAWLGRFGRNGRLMHFHSPGCEQCGGSGLRGRAGVHELLQASPTLRRMVQTGARSEEIQQQAMRAGMRTLRQDGIEKVLAGVASLSEVRSISNQ